MMFRHSAIVGNQTRKLNTNKQRVSLCKYKVERSRGKKIVRTVAFFTPFYPISNIGLFALKNRGNILTLYR